MSNNEDLSRFKYEEMANKVSKADKRFTSRRNQQESIQSQPKSLRGRITRSEMGSRLKSSDIKEKEEAKKNYQNREKSQAAASSNVDGISSSLLNSNFEGLSYFPKSHETAQVYQELLDWVYSQYSEDTTQDVIRSAADALLSAVKEATSDDVKVQCEQIVDSKITEEKWTELIIICKKITDYSESGESVGEEAMGVVFDDEEEEEENNNDDISDADDVVANDIKAMAGDILDDIENSLPQNEKEEVILLDSSSKLKIPLADISGDYLQTSLEKVLKSLDSQKLNETAEKVFELLKNYKTVDQNELKSQLVNIFRRNSGSEVKKYIELLVANRYEIYFRTQLLKFADSEDEKLKIITEMNDLELYSLIDELDRLDNTNNETGSRKKRKVGSKGVKITTKPSATPKAVVTPKYTPQYIELASLKFDQGSKLMTKSKVTLPNGSYKKTRKSYEEIHVPAPQKPDMSHIRLVPVSELPNWAQAAFPGSETTALNPVQSSVYPVAFETDKNILLCAPTGAGKTNVAMLTMLQTIQSFMDQAGNIDLSAFKIVYIAPLKALVQEQVREFQRRLGPLGLTVHELTGDSSMTKQQIKDTQVIITTPEKWDVITRKNSDTSYTNLVKLLIIDEIHLLHDERGPVLESLVARTLRQSEELDLHIRLVGLSATLPNYKDVAAFLRVSKDGLFYFDASYRPCPLAQSFIGVTEQKAFKQIQAINEACYDKVVENAGKFQIIIFVHSRKDTVKTAQYLRDKLLETEQLGKVLSSDVGSRELLKQESEVVKDPGLKDLIPTGFAVHHAGLSKEDRSIAEDLFADGQVQVLVSTATLAWGVNLPAHTVIIKGTQVYSPEKGSWTELSPQDILQMLGRAGRPRYDKNGEGIIITSHEEMQYYLAILNQQLPIESQLVSKLIDAINAEVVAGTISSMDEAISWLGYTYLYYRMLHSPSVYHVGDSKDVELRDKRADLAHSALVDLKKNNLVTYDEGTGAVSSTELGKIASYYYINADSMAIYMSQLSPSLTPVDLLRVFALSGEFKYIPSRQEEKQEIKTLLGKVPIPIKEQESDPLAKINVLLQAYVSRLSLTGFALISDMIYITQSANRIFRAIHEICLRKNWAYMAKMSLEFCKMVEHKMWLSNTPFRQFPMCPKEVIRKTESSRIPWSYYLTMETPQELGQSIGSEKFSKVAFEMIEKFPKIEFQEIKTFPITTSLLKFEINLLPHWKWDMSVHGVSERFLLLVEDVNGEKIMYQNSFLVRKEFVNDTHGIDFTVTLPASDTNKQSIVPPNYFVTLISEKWLNCEYKTPAVFLQTKLPKKFSNPTEVMDITPVSTKSLKVKEFASYFRSKNITEFNILQSQVFDQIYQGQENIFFGAPKGSGKTLLAELAIFNYWRSQKPGRVVFISPHESKLNELCKSWKAAFSNIAGGKSIAMLHSTTELSWNLRKINENHLLLATPESFDLVVKRWTRHRKVISKIDVIIFDDCHVVGEAHVGSLYEALISRVRFISSQFENENFRIVALSSTIANSRDFADWLGVKKENIYNFNQRVSPLEVHLKASNISHYPSFINSLVKTTYNMIKRNEDSSKFILFVSTRRQAIDLGSQFIKFAKLENGASSFNHVDLAASDENIAKQLSDPVLKSLVYNRIGILYQGIEENDKKILERLYAKGVVTVLFCTREACMFATVADTAIILGTQYFDGKEHRYVDYTASELLEMVGCVDSSDSSSSSSKAVIFTTTVKKDYYQRFLNFPVPVESHLSYSIDELFMDEVSNGVITTKQGCMDWLTYTFFYRRLQLNPSFYGVKDTSAMGLSEFLSEMIENALEELNEADIIEIEEEEEEEDKDDDDEEKDEEESISPSSISVIASHYGVLFHSLQTFITNLLQSSTSKSLRFYLEILSLSAEFENFSFLTIHKHEASILKKLYKRLPLQSNTLLGGYSVDDAVNFEKSIALKVFILLQAHFLRISLSPDLYADLKTILSVVLRLLNCMIDLLSSDGNLIVLRLMRLSQMIVQGVWEKDVSFSLKQIPFFNDKIIKTCSERNIQSVGDFVDLEDDEKLDLLGKEIAGDQLKLNKVIGFLNDYPFVNSIKYKVLNKEKVKADEDITVAVTVVKDDDADDDTLTVSSGFYPYEKIENWWIVIGNLEQRTLAGIRKVVLRNEEETFNLKINLAEGKHDLKIWLVCDSYMESEEISMKVEVV